MSTYTTCVECHERPRVGVLLCTPCMRDVVIAGGKAAATTVEIADLRTRALNRVSNVRARRERSGPPAEPVQTTLEGFA